MGEISSVLVLSADETLCSGSEDVLTETEEPTVSDGASVSAELLTPLDVCRLSEDMFEAVELTDERPDVNELVLSDVLPEQAVREQTINAEITEINNFFILHPVSIFRKTCCFQLPL